MPDNTSLPVAGGGNETFANHEISAVKYPRMRVTWGPSGVSNDADVASGKMLPTQLRHSGGTEIADSTGIKISTTQLATLGQAAMAASQPVVIASDQSVLPINGSVAHDAADANNPIKIGAKSTASMAGHTLVAAADRTNLFSDTGGALIVRHQTNLEDLVSAVAACTAGASTSVIASQGAGVKFYLTGGMLYNNGAANGACLITDGSGGTTKLKVPFPASTGTVFTLPVPIGFSAATAVFADPTGSDTIDVTLYGFKSKI